MLTFYFAPGSSSMAVHIALHETGAPFEARPMSFATKDMQKPEFLAINPNGKVPTLLVDGRVLTEVAGCLFYLARTYPDANLLPVDDPEAEAQVVSWMSFIASAIHPARQAGIERAREVWQIADKRLGATSGRSAAAIRSPTSTCSASTGAPAMRSSPRRAASPTSRRTTSA